MACLLCCINKPTFFEQCQFEFVLFEQIINHNVVIKQLLYFLVLHLLYLLVLHFSNMSGNLANWQYGLLILGIVFTMILIYLLVTTCFDVENYNAAEEQEEIKYLEEIFLCEHDSKYLSYLEFQEYHDLIASRTNMCAQFIPLEEENQSTNKTKNIFHLKNKSSHLL